MKISIGARGGLVVSAILVIRSQCQEERGKNWCFMSRQMVFFLLSLDMILLVI